MNNKLKLKQVKIKIQNQISDLEKKYSQLSIFSSMLLLFNSGFKNNNDINNNKRLKTNFFLSKQK